MTEDLIKMLELLNENSGWFFDFFVIVVAVGISATLLVHIYRFATGKSDWLGRSLDGGDQSSQMALIQLDTCRKENEELEKKVLLLENDRQELMDLLKEKKNQLEQKKVQLTKFKEEIEMLKNLYEELDQKYDDETYTMSQIMYTAEEVAAAIVDQERFRQNRDDIFMNLLDYLVNTLKNFRYKNPRVIIHVKYPEKNDALVHFAHSSGHSHRVKIYEPPIYGSAAGRAWRTNEVYYVPDVEDPSYEYDLKTHSRKVYRTILCVPIKAGNYEPTRIGVLTITGSPVNAYEDIEIERATLFASLLYPLIYIDLNKRGDKNGTGT
ncbi:GAF domain-containing protein [Thermoactinomyces mirandus]|uniref:GAF domain-containing protein n=1 Tax=Thermoactinomyces mirandus TaxID=2756294 RepID=A0A7W1XUS2_9BACL|nr:GAF domain-containing protein [Thermoactinomyces mirandus]MBA4603630.1 hypothetical protein [Thermoactinomyces mirandus]